MFHVKQLKMNNYKHVLTTKDFLVTGDKFDVSKNLKTGILETHPKPSHHDLYKYYDSKDYISHSQKPSSFFSFCYRQIRAISTKRKLKICSSQLKTRSLKNKARVLDVGCGTGYFLLKCLEKGWFVKGTENNKNARNTLPPEVSKHVYEGLEPLKQQSEKFDIITMWHSLEHLYDLTSAISDLKRLLRPNGTIIVACPNHKSFDAVFYKENWAAYDVPRHLWHFSQTSISRIFERHAMEVVSIRPMLFDSFYVSLLSEKYKGNKLYLFSAFFVGLWSNIKANFSKEYSSLIYVIKKKN